jgi:SAM-dependent methyltransferase
LALDLGCGTGRDTLVLLEQGWQVLALDAEPEALSALRERTPALLQGRLETRQARFETVTLPRCDLLNSSFALPFCEPAHFPALWNGITAAVRPGGLFCGQLFGERDSWASKGVTVVDAAALRRFLQDWDVLLHREEEEDGHTAVGRPKHWHIHHLVLQRR